MLSGAVWRGAVDFEIEADEGVVAFVCGVGEGAAEGVMVVRIVETTVVSTCDAPIPTMVVSIVETIGLGDGVFVF